MSAKRFVTAVLLLAAAVPQSANAARPVRVARLSLPGRPLSVAFGEVRGLLLVGTRKNAELSTS